MSSRRAVTAAPRATPGVVPAAVLVALLLVAAGVVAVRDLAVGQGWAAGDAWLATALTSLDQLRPTPVVVGVGVAAAVVGLLLLLAAARPGRRTHVRATGDAALWLTPRAVGSLAAGAVDRAEGVVAVEVTRASRRRVVVEAVTQPARERQDAGVRAARDAVDAGPGSLTSVRVVVRGREGQS